MNSESVDVRVAAATELGARYDGAAPRLHDLFQHLPRRAKLEVLCLIAQHDDEAAIRRAVRAFVARSQVPSCASARDLSRVAGILAGRRVPIPVEDLEPWLSSDEPEARVAALGWLRGSPDAFDRVRGLTFDRELGVRIAAMQVASLHADTEARRSVLARDLAARYRSGNFAAEELDTIALGLGTLSGDGEAPVLLAVLGDARLSAQTRRWVACAIIEKRDGADPACMKRPVDEVVESARQALVGP